MTAELVVENVSKEYTTRAEPVVVLRGISLRMQAGDNLAIVGPSGSGKSTLLHILGTLERPTGGTVRLGPLDLGSLTEIELARFRNRQVGFVFQDHHLLPQCSALENVLIPTLAFGRTTPAELARGRELLELVGLRERAGHRPAELSGGERQRVALARALIKQPALLLADEPTGNLDRTTATQIGELLLELAGRHRSILIVVTHSSELAARFARQSELDQGRLLELPLRK